MSTLKCSNLQNASAASPAIVLDANSRATLNGLSYPTEGSLSGRNRIINGDMRIDQRNAGASVTVNSSNTPFCTDRFQVRIEQATAGMTAQQSTTAPAGFVNSLLMTVTNTTAPAAGNRVNTRQIIEGFNVADLGWGSASAQTVTLSFWVRSSVTGTYGVGFINSAENRSYVGTYTVNAANTFEYKTITVPGDTSGTWVTNNGNGIRLTFDLGSGTSFNATANTWVAQEACRTSGCVNWQQNTGATFYITGVQLEAGSVATPFERRNYGQELALCQRYCEVVQAAEDAQRFALSGNGTTTIFPTYFFKVTKRAAPTLTVSAAGDFKKESYASNTAAASSVGSNRANVDSLTFSVATANTDAGGNLLANNANAKVTFSSEL